MARIDGLKDPATGRFMHSWKMYPLLKDRGFMACESRLADHGGQCGIYGVRIHIKPKFLAQHEAADKRQPFVHRVMAECDCGKLIPFGKLGQHRKACRVNVYEDQSGLVL